MRLHRCAVVVLAATLAATASSAFAQTGSSPLIGIYEGHGVNAKGDEYRTFVVIAAHGDSLLVVWRPVQLPEGTLAPEPDAVGVGIASDRTLSIAFYGKQGSGLAVFTCQDDGSLVGQWTTAGGDGTLYPEILTKITGHPAPAPLPPTEDEGPPAPEPLTVRAMRAA
jgi:hypothetical protein